MNDDRPTKRQGPIEIGGVPFQVGDAPLAGLADHPQVTLRRELPSLLVERLRAGEVEGALVSSIEAFRAPGYQALPDLGIACDRRVGSVRLFCRTEPGAVRHLAVDSGSQTSVALAKILLTRVHGATLERVSVIEATRRPAGIDADAVLLIGDAGNEADPEGLRSIDLGAEWFAWTNLPFVFALWLFRTTTERAELAHRTFHAVLARAEAEGIKDGTGGLIRHRLTDAHLRGLERFRLEAAALGLCEPEIVPTWVNGREGGRSSIEITAEDSGEAPREG